MRIEWDSNKAASNLKKHKVRFEEALTVFGDPLALIFYDEKHSWEEHREVIVGHSALNRLLIVCFTDRDRGRVRIISARKATKKEHRKYEENIDVQDPQN